MFFGCDEFLGCLDFVCSDGICLDFGCTDLFWFNCIDVFWLRWVLGCLDFVCSDVLAAAVDLIASARNSCSIVSKCSLTLLIAALCTLAYTVWHLYHCTWKIVLGTVYHCTIVSCTWHCSTLALLLLITVALLLQNAHSLFLSLLMHFGLNTWHHIIGNCRTVKFRGLWSLKRFGLIQRPSKLWHNRPG